MPAPDASVYDCRLRASRTRDGAHALLESARLTSIAGDSSLGPCRHSRSRRRHDHDRRTSGPPGTVQRQQASSGASRRCGWIADGSLAALVTRDAEFDHFEALRDGLEPALTTFIASAARDEMRELEELSASLPGRRSGTLAFTGATLIRRNGRRAHSQRHSRDSRRTHRRRRSRGLDAGAVRRERIDLTGRYIIPGLWDMHAHYEQVEWGPIYLAAGVTTVRDVGNELEFIAAVRDAIRARARPGSATAAGRCRGWRRSDHAGCGARHQRRRCRDAGWRAITTPASSRSRSTARSPKRTCAPSAARRTRAG